MNSENIENLKIYSEEITLKEVYLKTCEWFRYVLSKWVIIILTGIIGAVLGYFYAKFKSPIYTATTTFVLEEGGGGSAGLGQYAGLASMAGIDLGGGGGGVFQGDNIIQLYTSRTMIEKALLGHLNYSGKTNLLIDRYIEFNDLRNKWSKSKTLNGISFKDKSNFSRLQDSIISGIVEDINSNYLNVYRPDKKLSIIKASVTSKDELFAKAFNEQIVKTVNEFYINTKAKKSIENVLILKQKTDSVRAVMNGDIYNASVIADATPNLNPTRQIQRVAPVQKSQFSAETNKEMLIELIKNLEMSKISQRKETPLIQVIDEPIFPLQKVMLSKFKGFFVGGFLGTILTMFFIVIRKTLKGIISE